MYLKNIDICAQRILSALNRDPNSNSCGCFDRYFWGWKKRDFPDSTLQFAFVPLMKSGILNAGDLAELSEKVLDFTEKIIYSDGTCDQNYPHEKHPKTFFDIAPLFITLHEHAVGEKKKHRIANILRKGFDYSIRYEENYAVISNHAAHEMHQCLTAWQLLGDEKYYKAATDYLHLIKKHESADGFHREYKGGDPGYETRTLKYLVKCIDIFRKKEKEICEEMCLKSCSFLDKVIMPDGTLYAMFGSRNTALVYPSGIEYMTLHYPGKFSNLARKLRFAIENSLSPEPVQLEFDNFIRLFDDYLNAQKLFNKNKELPETESKNASFEMSDFGLSKIVKDDLSVFVHYKYGGACAVYKGNRLIAKDAGLLVSNKKGEFFGTRNLLKYSEKESADEKSITVKTELFKSVEQDLNPFKMLILRTLNLSILRVPFIANIFRKIVVGKLITGVKSGGHGNSERVFSIEKGKVIIKDRVSLDFVPESVHRCAYLHLFHMASSRYSYPVDRNIVKDEKLKLHTKTFSTERTIII